MSMSQADYDHFLNMVKAEKLKIEKIIGIYQVKNLSIAWVLFVEPAYGIALVEAMLNYSSRAALPNLQIVNDANRITWELRATIRFRDTDEK